MELARVVIGVDLTGPSTRAAKWVAQRFAPDAEVVMVHCVSPSLGERGRAELQKLAAVCLSDLEREIGVNRCSYRIHIGDPVRCLADIAANVDADLIAVGSHEEHPDRLPALGSTAERLVRCSPVPVLLCSATPSGAPRSVLLPLESVEVTSELADWTGSLTERFGARLALVHVEPPRARLTSRHPSQRSARSTTPWTRVAHELPTHRVFVDAVIGDRADAVIAESRRFGTELVLLQAEDDATLPDSTVKRVLRRSECSVLIIPSVENARLAATR